MRSSRYAKRLYSCDASRRSSADPADNQTWLVRVCTTTGKCYRPAGNVLPRISRALAVVTNDVDCPRSRMTCTQVFEHVRECVGSVRVRVDSRILRST